MGGSFCLPRGLAELAFSCSLSKPLSRERKRYLALRKYKLDMLVVGTYGTSLVYGFVCCMVPYRLTLHTPYNKVTSITRKRVKTGSFFSPPSPKEESISPFSKATRVRCIFVLVILSPVFGNHASILRLHLPGCWLVLCTRAAIEIPTKSVTTTILKNPDLPVSTKILYPQSPSALTTSKSSVPSPFKSTSNGCDVTGFWGNTTEDRTLPLAGEINAAPSSPESKIGRSGLPGRC
jgi:hypothetical protein